MHKRNKRYIVYGAFILNLSGIVASGVSTLYALRDNNIRSGELYLALQKADESGVGVSEALQALQVHVAAHMNASPLPQLGENAPVQLTKSYERAKLAESTRATSERERVNAEAIAYCEAVYGRSNLVTRTQCVADYGTSHPVMPERQIVADLYRYDFVSPQWTPDRAGWLLVLTFVLIVIFLLQVVPRVIARSLMKQ